MHQEEIVEDNEDGVPQDTIDASLIHKQSFEETITDAPETTLDEMDDVCFIFLISVLIISALIYSCRSGRQFDYSGIQT